MNSVSSTSAASTFHGNETDRLALLAIKARITDDPLGITHSWNDSNHFCNWTGIICSHRHQRVTMLNLSSYDLVGTLSPYVGNLTFLSGLNLEVNNFHGEIPQELGLLFRLKYLNISNNSFSGEIPANLSHCSNLIWLRLGVNRLIGRIPYQLGSLQKLERFQLHYNNLTGPIPDSLGNLSSIKSLSFAVNSLEGRIPDTLGKLSTLNFLGFGLNQLSGIIPPSVYNLSSITVFSLPYNQLHGNLPSDLGFTLPNLLVLNIGHNQFTGPLPVSISNASNLLEFDINGSNFTGKVAIDFAGLASLWWLVFASNSLGNGEANDLSLLNSLTNCRILKVLDLSDNQFGGVIPDSVANLSTQLLSFRLGSNRLSGTIPLGIQNLANLTELTVEKNNITGSIPSVAGKLQMLKRLDLSDNKFSGFIPSSLGNLTQLYVLHLEKNLLMGTIPSCFGDLISLQQLDLSQNFIDGTIPKKLMALSSLKISLNLAQNELVGPLPSEVGSLKNLGYLDVSENKLSGEIPSTLGKCLTLEHLHMEGNSFEGVIPPPFSSLRGLRDLDLSRNNLSGQIPRYFQRMSFLNFNISFNNFEGEIPTQGVFRNATAISIAGNKKLCGGVPELKLSACPIVKSQKGKMSQRLKLIIASLSGLLAIFVLIIPVLIIYRLRKMRREPSALFTKEHSSTASLSAKHSLSKVSFESLFKATGGFSPDNLIGSGSFGSVYKGVLDPNGTVVAVKVLYLNQRGALKSFIAECDALRSTRHRNLIKIITVCSSVDFKGNDFKALVYEFMPNGSLESWLHPVPTSHVNDEPKILSLLQRLNIAIDVASALEYLHNHCHKPITHCDLKPSNILLNDDLTAQVGDFGLARFIPEAANIPNSNQSSSVGLKGTVGYAAPEYGMGSKVSAHGDIYSCGIILLEMFTGKRPTDEMFKDGLDLHNFVKMSLPGRLSEILDPLFVSGDAGEEQEEIIRDNSSVGNIKIDQKEECLIAILRVGIACSAESPRDRMKIDDLVHELQVLKDIIYGLEMY